MFLCSDAKEVTSLIGRLLSPNCRDWPSETESSENQRLLIGSLDEEVASGLTIPPASPSFLTPLPPADRPPAPPFLPEYGKKLPPLLL